MKKSKIVKAATELMDAMKPDLGKNGMDNSAFISYVTSDLQKPIKNLMIALDRWSDPDNIFHGDGIYKAGKYGISLFSNEGDIYFEELDEDDENYEEGPLCDIYAGDGAILLLKSFDELKSFDDETDGFVVTIINESYKGIPVECSMAIEGRVYFGTDHSIFGSGNTSLIHKF